MAKKTFAGIDGVIDCACVIHGDTYSWQYVERLYSMLTRHLPGGIRFHVYTERSRPVPPHMIKHELTEWTGISGPKKSWWYKLQLFDPGNHDGNLLYFDLDMVLVRDIDWIRTLDPKYFWSIKDFKYLQKPHVTMINSSVMWWNVSEYSYVWERFIGSDIFSTARRLPGDQDFLAQTVDRNQQKFFDEQYFQSYRWQALDGGFDFVKRQHLTPNTGVAVGEKACALVFHGRPKPHEVDDPVVHTHWC
jgi:hypothetical protein